MQEAAAAPHMLSLPCRCGGVCCARSHQPAGEGGVCPTGHEEQEVGKTTRPGGGEAPDNYCMYSMYVYIPVSLQQIA